MILILQLRRVTFWTRNEPELPDLTESESEDDSEGEEEKEDFVIPEGRSSYVLIQQFLLICTKNTNEGEQGGTVKLGWKTKGQRVLFEQKPDIPHT